MKITRGTAFQAKKVTGAMNVPGIFQDWQEGYQSRMQ